MTAWLGPRFEPWCLHHPVLGSRPSSAFECLSRLNGGFSHTHPSPWVVSAWQKAPIEGLSPHQKFPFPASAETGSMTGW
jgi:hypothetical protein